MKYSISGLSNKFNNQVQDDCNISVQNILQYLYNVEEERHVVGCRIKSAGDHVFWHYALNVFSENTMLGQKQALICNKLVAKTTVMPCINQLKITRFNQD